MAKRLIVFSVDAMVTEDVEAMRSLPNFRKYLAGGSEFKNGMRTIYPSVTYPIHVSILTGCYADKHKVTSNFGFTTEDKDATWLFSSENTAVEDIFAAAKRAGLSTASISWPVTGRNPNIDYLIDEYWFPHSGETMRAGFADMGSSEEMLDIMDSHTDLLPPAGNRAARRTSWSGPRWTISGSPAPATSSAAISRRSPSYIPAPSTATATSTACSAPIWTRPVPIWTAISAS